MPGKMGGSNRISSKQIRDVIKQKKAGYIGKPATVDILELHYANSMLKRINMAKTLGGLRGVRQELKMHTEHTNLGHGRGLVISPMSHGETSDLVTAGVWRHKELLGLLEKRLAEREKELGR
ncbi:MAG: hypothetical protein V1676_04955 [Candidatus Diapherotrites archaeon]